jgi:hypothetical protein
VTQNDLHRAISRATGESVATIKRIGFMIEEPGVAIDDPHDPALGPHVLDWDAFEEFLDAYEPEPLALAG